MQVPTRRFGRTEIQIPIFSCGGMRYQQSWERKETDKVRPNFSEINETRRLMAAKVGQSPS